MYVQIITPEKTLFEGEVDSINLPGTDGRFHILNHHAAIVSSLKEGIIEVHTHTQEFQDYQNGNGKVQTSPLDDKILQFSIKGGVIEFNNNKAIVLAD
ncbi:MAG: hypothetical protein C4K58_01675 [Flavobacteriaceae bacterium]|nr:MAG: hypothetical protein C4K58_01675 [Flavobacteriaceae bacterium]